MNYSRRPLTAFFAAVVTLQVSAMLPALAKTVKAKGSGHKFGFGWLKKGQGVHKNGYSKNYKNPKP